MRVSSRVCHWSYGPGARQQPRRVRLDCTHVRMCVCIGVFGANANTYIPALFPQTGSWRRRPWSYRPRSLTDPQWGTATAYVRMHRCVCANANTYQSCFNKQVHSSNALGLIGLARQQPHSGVRLDDALVDGARRRLL